MNPHVRGFADVLLAAGVVVALLVGFGALQTHRLHAEQKAFTTFKAEAKALGEAQDKRAKEENARNLKAKESADAQNTKLLASNAALSRSLRESRSRAGILSGAPAGSSRPDVACFARADLERALQQFDGSVTAIVEQGDQARISLDGAKDWAKALK